MRRRIRWPASVAALGRVLRIPRVLAVEGAFLVFAAVEFGTWVAILVYAYRASGPDWVGPVAVLQLVPAAAVAPLAATLGDRMERGRALALSHLVVAGAMGAVGMSMLVGAPPPLTYALAIVAACTVTMVRPLQAAILPALVGTAEQLTAANAVTAVLEGLGILAGPLAAGIVLATSSPGVVFAGAGIASLAASALVAVVVARRSSAGSEGRHRVADGSPAAAPGVVDGIRAVASRRGSMVMISLIGVRFAVIGAMDVVLVLAAIELLRMGNGGAGYLNAAIGLGSVVGGAAALVLVGRLTLAPFLVVGGLVWFAPLAGIGLAPHAVAAIGLLMAAGLGLALFDVAARTLLQRVTPIASLASVFGVVEAFSMAGLAVGALLAGPLARLVSVPGALVACGAALPLAVLLALPLVRQEETRITIPLREIRLLRRLALFAPLPAAAIETAARALVRTARRAGTVIVREGDVGDAFYVIEDGRVLVTRGRVAVRELAAGDGFGEIALLRDVPRTASVIALTDVELASIVRDEFLLAVTGSPKAVDEAHRLIDAYRTADAKGGDLEREGSTARAAAAGTGVPSDGTAASHDARSSPGHDP